MAIRTPKEVWHLAVAASDLLEPRILLEIDAENDRLPTCETTELLRGAAAAIAKAKG